MTPLIINAALTGMIPTKKDNPNLPVSPREIAADALRCWDAGASIVHLHARDDLGEPTWLKEVYQNIVDRVRGVAPDLIVCVSTSGRMWGEIEKRSEALGVLSIEMASLTLGSMNFPSGPSINSPEIIKDLAYEMGQRGILPELEVFDLGMLGFAKHLISQAVLTPPFYFNLFLGSVGTIEATPQNLTTLLSNLPEGAIWAATGVGRYQFEINCLAMAMGGHVRVGLEDSIWLGKGELATNARQVERVVKVARAMGREPATTEQARQMIWNH